MAGINVNIGDLNKSAGAILMGAKNAQSLYRKNSVSALARDLIMQYPVLMSADIDYATGVTLTKALEMQFATLQLMVLSADTAFGVDPMKNAGVRDLLSQYHSNADVPNMVNYAGNLMGNVAGAAKHFGIESAQSDDTVTSVKVNKAVESSKGVTADFVKSLWEYDSEGLIMESVNDMYNPGKSIVNTIASIADGVEKRVATEASKYDDYDDDDYLKDSTKSVPDSTTKPGSGANAYSDRIIGGINNLGRDLSDKNRKTGFKEYDVSKASTDDKGKPIIPSGAKFNKGIEDKYSKLEPLLIDVEFFVQNGEHGSRIQKATIGISAMTRAIPSDIMRANIIKALQHNHSGFNFIQWTRGEKKLVRDFIFNISSIKEDALAKSKYDKWFAALKKRKNNAKAFKGGNSPINPLSTIVITKNDAAIIRENAGFDLTEEKDAIALMDSLYLLCFMIVDTDTGCVSTIMDGQNYFMETTVDALKKSGKKDSVNYTDIREMMKLMGR